MRVIFHGLPALHGVRPEPRAPEALQAARGSKEQMAAVEQMAREAGLKLAESAVAEAEAQAAVAIAELASLDEEAHGASAAADKANKLARKLEEALGASGQSLAEAEAALDESRSDASAMRETLGATEAREAGASAPVAVACLRTCWSFPRGASVTCRSHSSSSQKQCLEKREEMERRRRIIATLRPSSAKLRMGRCGGNYSVSSWQSSRSSWRRTMKGERERTIVGREQSKGNLLKHTAPPPATVD